jgi:Spy/CpxP family protein refolding chaperone
MNKITHKKSLVGPLSTLCLSLLLVSPLSAGENPKTGQVNHQKTGQNFADSEERFDAVAERLGLSDEQKEKIKTLRQAQKQQMEALMQEMRVKQQQIQSELNKPAATRESIAPIATEIKAIHAKLVDLRINNIFAIKEMLNAEQFSKLSQVHQNRAGAMKDRRQNWLEKRRENRDNKQEKNEEQ